MQRSNNIGLRGYEEESLIMMYENWDDEVDADGFKMPKTERAWRKVEETVQEKVVAKAEPKPVKEAAPAVKVKTVIVEVPEYQESSAANDAVDFDFDVAVVLVVCLTIQFSIYAH